MKLSPEKTDLLTGREFVCICKHCKHSEVKEIPGLHTTGYVLNRHGRARSRGLPNNMITVGFVLVGMNEEAREARGGVGFVSLWITDMSSSFHVCRLTTSRACLRAITAHMVSLFQDRRT
jgi:hypothetical protein